MINSKILTYHTYHEKKIPLIKNECNFFSLLCLISHSLTFKILEGCRRNVGELEWKHRIWIALMDAFSSSPLSTLLTCWNLRCLSLTENSLIGLKFQRSFQFRPQLKNTYARAKLGGYCSWVECGVLRVSREYTTVLLNSSRSFSKHHRLIVYISVCSVASTLFTFKMSSILRDHTNLDFEYCKHTFSDKWIYTHVSLVPRVPVPFTWTKALE